MPPETTRTFPAFERDFLSSDRHFSVIGQGALGGKASGLAFIKSVLDRACPPDQFRGVQVAVPRLTVLTTDVFEQFMARNDLWPVALSEEPDRRIAHAFQKADLPAAIVGDLRALMAEQHTPLAVRSSSLLEDALQHPFAGTYATKMIANNEESVAVRFRKLVEAIKFVFASTFFADAKAYMRTIRHDPRDERMAVVIQQVVGRRHAERFYPDVAGVVRSYNFYPTKPAVPADGVMNLALGLGKTIVDGGVTWTISPRYPNRRPPYGTLNELLENTQTRFWAVNMRPLASFDPVSESEYLVEGDLEQAEYDGTLNQLASTYDGASDRLRLGLGSAGPRVLTFGPLLELGDVPLCPLVRHLAEQCRTALGAEVEIEFALTLGPERGLPVEFGFLQLRPMMVSDARIDVAAEELARDAAIVASEMVLGNGEVALRDVVYVRPETFEPRLTQPIALELEALNRDLVEAGCAYVLVGFGRWGSSDPWLGIPVTWPQISGARVIVEATRPEMNVDPSQGTHFFHNLTSFQVQYLTVHHTGSRRIDWEWLNALPAERETEHVRHVRAPAPLRCRVDARAGRGVILRPA
jgi:hypothetical protein